MNVATLTSGRLALRPLVGGDAKAIAAGLGDWEVTRWLTTVPFPYGIADAHDFLHTIADDPEDRHWAIDAGQGLIGVVSGFGAISRVRSLDYWLSAAHHGKGFMTEAAGRVVDWHFAAATEPLRSGYHLGNARSARVLEKLGFQPGEVEADRQVSTGRMVDIQRMWLTRDRWDILRSQTR
ncbi:MAG: GNAT family N-acetyltransferase [Paracoccaceae bacterium]